MNNLKKQIIAASVAASSILSIVPQVMAAVPADVSGTRYEEPVQILSALNIMVGDENGEFRLDDTIIRSEVAKMAVHTMGLEDAADASKGQTKFDDVSKDHWANGYINLAVEQGIIVGDGDGNFRPNSPITYAEAMTIMVRATGYAVPAEQNGGYPQGYVKTGNSNGLSKNVLGSTHEEISRGNVAYLTANALDVNLMEQTGFGENSRYEVTDKTLLKDNHKVTKEIGQVTAVGNSSLTGSSNLNKNQVKIGNEIFETSFNMNSLLGYNVEYYLRKDGGESKIILAIPVQSQNNELTISADLFSKLSSKNGNTVVEYFKDESASKALRAEIAKNAILVYNGKYEEMATELIDMSDKAGKLTMLDTNKDGKYDIVFVKSYENIVVDKVFSSGKIEDKYSSKTLKLDEDVDYVITKGLEEVEVSELKEYDVLSVAASLDNKLFDISLSTKTVEGKVTGKDSNGVRINGEKYKVAANYPAEISIGTEGVFYLDVDGKIAATDKAVNSAENYGYLIRAHFSSTANDRATFKIFTSEGKTVTFDGNAKIKFNGKSNVKASEVVDTINGADNKTEAQLITYTVNSDDKVIAVNTAVDNTASGAADNENFTLNRRLENAKYSKALSKLGGVRISKDTVIFDIGEDEDDYAVRDMDVFEDNQSYNAMIFDMSSNYTAGAVVLTNAQLSANADADIAVVKEVVTASNDNDEETDMLIALEGGKEVSVYAKNENVLIKNGKKLETGDIIQYRKNTNGEIISVRVLFDIASKENEASAEPEEKLETVYGRVTRKFADSINVTVSGGADTNYTIPSDVTVYSVDTTVSKNQVTKADISDIHVYDSEENNRVFIKIYDNTVSEIVIIK